MGEIRADQPLIVERMLDARGGVDCVGSVVAAVNQGASGAGRKAAGVGGHDAGERRRVHCLESRDPAILRQIVVKEAETRAEDRGSGLATV